MVRERLLTWPNRLTVLRIILLGPFVVMLLNLQSEEWTWSRHAAVGLFLIMVLSDILDGYLARRFNQETRLGRFLDPVADKLLITCAVILLGIEGTSVPGLKFPGWVVVAAIGKDVFVVVGFLLVFIETGKIFIKPDYMGKFCTASQMALIIVTLLAPDIISFAGAEHFVYGLVHFLWILVTFMALVVCWDYFRSGMRFTEGKEI